MNSYRPLLVLAVTLPLLGPNPVEAKEPPELRNHAEVNCTDVDDITLDGVYISSKETAITALGTCQIVIRNSHIVGGKAALHVAGTANVVITNSVIESNTGMGIRLVGAGQVQANNTTVVGKKASVKAAATSQFITTNGTFFGKKRKSALARIVDKGANKWRRYKKRKARPTIVGPTPPATSVGTTAPASPTTAPASPTTAPASPTTSAVLADAKGLGLVAGSSATDNKSAAQGDGLSPQAPFICEKQDNVVLDGVVIDGSEPIGIMKWRTAIHTMGGCNLVIKNSHLKGKDYGIVVQGSSSVTILNSRIDSPKVAMMVQGSANLSIVGSKVKGKRALKLEGSASMSSTKTVFRGRKTIGRSTSYSDLGGTTWKRR